MGQSPAFAAPEGEAPSTLCTVSDNRLNEISGLVATDSGYFAINDTGNDDADSLRVFSLDKQCGVADVQNWTGEEFNPLDPEDLARSSDGTLWVADIGDNDASRPRAAIWRIAKGADPVLHRLTYPDGPRDAEAILMQGKTPIVVTKDATGTSQVYVASKPLTSATTDITSMRSAGTLTISSTGTSGGDAVGIGEVGQLTITGGAVSPDGKKVALRTYTDAYEWDVKNGDIAAAITGGKPRHTPLPNEPQGEAISYSADGSSFITTTEGADPPLKQWKPVAPTSGDDKAKATKKGDSGPWYKDITLDQVMYGIYCAGAVGLILLAGGVYGIIRHRRRVKNGLAGDDGGAVPLEEDEGDEEPLPPVSKGGQIYGRPAEREHDRRPVPEDQDRAGWPPEPPARPERSTQGAVYGGQPRMSLPPNPNRRPSGAPRQPERQSRELERRPEMPERRAGGSVYGGKPDDRGRPPGTVYGG